MRTFIALDLPLDVRREIKKIQTKLPEFSGKLTEIENLHLTLKFLGEIDDEKINEIEKRLEKIKIKKIDAEIDSIGVFSESFIKIVWLHIAGCEKLQEEVDNKLEDLFPKENRFMSHITIARVKNIKNKKEFLEKIKKIKIEKIKFSINSFKLKKSILTGEKPVYEDLLEIKLI